jgi:ribosomal protein S12 methylthiotransferase accessory factor
MIRALSMNMEITFPEGKKVDAVYEGYVIKTDQPLEEGGTGTAPSPFSLFLASIGTCAGFYVLSFCQRRGISTKEIKLLVEIDRNKETHMAERINIEVQVPGSFPDDYKNAMVKAAQSCTVKRHLEKPPEINVSVKKHEM